MRTAIVVAAVAALFFVTGCTSQETVDRANDLRSVAERLEQVEATLGSAKAEVEAGTRAFEPLIAQVIAWAPQLAEPVRQLQAAGYSAPDILDTIVVLAGTRADAIYEEADRLEASASDEGIANLVNITTAVLAGLFGVGGIYGAKQLRDAPSPKERETTARAIKLIEDIDHALAVAQASAGPPPQNPMPHTPHPPRSDLTPPKGMGGQ